MQTAAWDHGYLQRLPQLSPHQVEDTTLARPCLDGYSPELKSDL